MKRAIYEIRVNRNDGNFNIGFFSSVKKSIKMLEDLTKVKINRKLLFTGLKIGYYKVTVKDTIYSMEKHYLL